LAALDDVYRVGGRFVVRERKSPHSVGNSGSGPKENSSAGKEFLERPQSPGIRNLRMTVFTVSAFVVFRIT